MSKTTDIFVDSEKSLDSLVKDVESLLNVGLQLVCEHQENWYEFRNSQVSMTLGEHEFDSDRDLNFEDYRYWISIRSLNFQTEAEHQKQRDDFANLLFEKLKATRQYSLMLVEDLQVKLEEFSLELVK